MKEEQIKEVEQLMKAGGVPCPCKCRRCKRMGSHKWSYHFTHEHKYT